MAQLAASERAKLADSAFAYIDSRGVRRLPIYDASHVRNALARFNQVAFESDASRDRARKRLLSAARKYRIVPIGFVERELDRGAPASLPSGFVTLLMTDIEGSTDLVHQLQDKWRDVITDVRALLRAQVAAAQGSMIEARADDSFAVFAQPLAAVDAALGIQRALQQRAWADGVAVRVRVGIHSGYPTLGDRNYLGVPVHLAARICGAAHGGQIVLSGDTKLALTESTHDHFGFKRLGPHRLRGIPEEVALFQVTATGLGRKFPALRIG